VNHNANFLPSNCLKKKKDCQYENFFTYFKEKKFTNDNQGEKYFAGQ